MAAVFTYSYIDSKSKKNKIKTHPIGTIEEFVSFVLANKEYIIWANLMDVINGDVVEQYVNIKNYQNSGIDNAKLVLSGKDIAAYKKVYIIHKLEFEAVVKFIKATKIDFYNKLVAERAFRSLKLSSFFKKPIAEQFLVFPANIYDLIMGEFATQINYAETRDFEELIPIAKEIFIEVEEVPEA